jgi:outer membrane protein insertion porin family
MRVTQVLLLFLVASGVASAQQVTPGRPTLVFAGNDVFSEQDLRSITDKCLAMDSHWKEGYNSQTLEYCLKRLQLSLAAKGYLQATVGKPISTTTEAGILLKVSVSEGALFRLQEVRIDGARAFSPARLRELLNLKTGDIANGDVIDEWLFDAAKKAYNELGYIQYTAQVEPDFHLKQGGTEGAVDLAITIDEGRRFYVRSIHFNGNGDVSESLLVAQMLIQSGEVYNSELLKQSLTRIDQTSQFETIDFDKDLDYRSVRDSQEIDIVVHLKKKRPPL